MRIIYFDRHAHCLLTEEEFGGKSRFYDIKRYLEKQEYPTNASIYNMQTLRRLATKFLLNGDVIYKRNYGMVLIRCVDKHEADMFIKEIHEGSFGTQANGHAMAIKFRGNILTG